MVEKGMWKTKNGWSIGEGSAILAPRARAGAVIAEKPWSLKGRTRTPLRDALRAV